MMESRNRVKKRLGDMLVEEGAITQAQLEEGLAAQKRKGQKLGYTLIELGYTNEIVISKVLSKQLSLPLINLLNVSIEKRVLDLVKEDVLRRYIVIPYEIDRNNRNVLHVAMADPMDFNAIDDLSIITNMHIEPSVATTKDINMAIDKYYGNSKAMEAAGQYALERESRLQEEADTSYQEDIDSSPIVLLVRTMIEQAVRKRASDVHIEPMERSLRVRYRIDGILTEAMSYGLNMLPAISTRIKIISGMDISEKRKPQDGRMTLRVDREEYDIRVSVLPTVYGEKIVMRLASKSGFTMNKRLLGLTQEDMDLFDDLFHRPYGIILVTGPTGSGKSTTLYTALSEINDSRLNIVTVEDPVEANIDGINQVQVNVRADLTFASALRSILRQDPDIIMIGEIRDGETAEIAVRSAITGHLVVSTVHTNNAAGTITRLIDMGIEPFLAADSVIGVIAQRLVRKLCPDCKRKRTATQEEKHFLGIPEGEPFEVYEAVGCHKCNNTGYFGRIGVYEIMPVTARIRASIVKGGTGDEIQKIALEDGMRTIRAEAKMRVLEGVTTVDEMRKISYEEE